MSILNSKYLKKLLKMLIKRDTKENFQRLVQKFKVIWVELSDPCRITIWIFRLSRVQLRYIRYPVWSFVPR